LRLIALILFLIFLSGIIAPILSEREKNDWSDTLVDKIDFVANSINRAFEIKTDHLISAGRGLKTELRAGSVPESSNKSLFFKLLNDRKYTELSIQLYDKTNKLLAWNSEPVLKNDELYKLERYTGQSFFSSRKLITYLSFLDTLKTGEDYLFMIISLPVDKHYSLSQKNTEYETLTDSLSNVLSTRIDFKYSASAPVSRDGRKYSFSVLNNFMNKIGVATFDKPSLDNELDGIQKEIILVQYSLVLLIIIIAGIWLRGYIFGYKRKLFRFISISLFLIVFRILLFEFDIPTSFIDGSINDPAHFSSVFAFGMVRSPLEFFVTIIFLLIVVLSGYYFAVKYFEENNGTEKKNFLRSTFIAIVLAFLYLLSLRGLGAAIRSVIFDSTIRYFKEFALIPSPPIFLMIFNILILGFCSVLFSIILLRFILFQFRWKGNRTGVKYLLLIFLFFQISGWLFDLIQREPQGTPLIRIIYISITFLLVYLIIFQDKKTGIIFVYYAFAASIVSLILLTYYNSRIERESLKTTAHELTRMNEDLVRFMVFQTLVQIQQNERTLNSFSQSNNLSSDAFILWTGSLLYRQGIPSAINFFDRSNNFIGGYQTGKIVPFHSIRSRLQEMPDSLKIIKEADLYGDRINFTGIIPVKRDDVSIGYAVVSAIYSDNYFSYDDLPKILDRQRAEISNAVNFSKLKIFDFQNGELIRSYGGVTLSTAEQKEIMNAQFSSYSESWMNLGIKNENHLVYLFKVKLPSKEKIIAVALEEKNFSWNLSDFFKVLFVHTLIITSLIILFAAVRFKKTKIVFTSYRTRLIGAFLFISLIPLIIIALYFRDITEKKNTQLIEKRLTEMSEQVKFYLNLYSSGNTLDELFVYEKAARDLNINYSVFSGKDLIYSSQEIYNEVGLLHSTLNSMAYLNCILLKNRTISSSEEFESIPVHSVYLSAENGNRHIVIKVDDLFNKVTVPLSDLELDIFLFGVFSLAFLLLFILSTVLADQISSPIRKLTMATKSVGSGDLNVEVSYKTSGEIKDLVDGFNRMVKKINHSQIEIARMERESAWKEMAKQVAHEIKNPLTPMKLNVQQLITAYRDKSPKFDSIFEKVTETIVSQIETLKNIANEFSNFARMPRLNIEKLNAVEVVRESVNLFAEENREIKFICENEIITVNADRDHLSRTMINLIRNSIQAMSGLIVITINTGEGFCAIRVSDDGHGIEPENISRVFDENFTTKKSGMGVGLNLAKKFVDGVGGSIAIEKSTPDGTIILLTLPLAE